MSQALPLLFGKITPPALPENLVPRRRISESIHRRLGGLPVLVVCASAGAGKTTAVRIAFIDEPNLGWVTLDGADSSPGRFLTYLAGALSHLVPSLPTMVNDALAASAPHAEVAGLFIEKLADVEDVVLVIDQVDQVVQDPRSVHLLDSMVRFMPKGVRLVLISRTAFTLASGSDAGAERLDYLIDQELAFTEAETATALRLSGREPDESSLVQTATGGWVMGVIFAGSNSEPTRMSLQPEIDPLHAYLRSHLLDQLPPDLREFLISTCLLTAVDAERANALGLERAEALLTELRARRMPVVWQPGGKSVRYHPVLRDYLLILLERRSREDVVQLRTRFGRLLATEGFMIEATEELLAVGAYAEALPHAEASIDALIDRQDYEVVDRWLELLADQGQSGNSPLTTAELVLAVAREEYWRGTRIADQLNALGQREAVAASSSRAAAMMVWCYYHAYRSDDIASILQAAKPGPEVEIASVLVSLIDDQGFSALPLSTGSGAATNELVVRMLYWQGRLLEATQQQSGETGDSLTEAWRIAPLRAIGALSEAHSIYRRIEAAGRLTAGIQAVVGAELFADLGMEAESRASFTQGRASARRIGSVVWDLYSQLSEAKLELRVCRNPARARVVLDLLESTPLARDYLSTAEQIDTLYGLCHLMSFEYAEAYQRLDRAVNMMRRSGRVLELPVAAVYLAEAAWNCGEELKVDELLEIAMDAARRQGTNAVILRALREFPNVLSRKLDSVSAGDSEWHRLGEQVLATTAQTRPLSRLVVELVEFGAQRIVVGGEEVHPRISKCHDLLALFATRQSMSASRSEVLDALFDSRDTASTRSYLRQVVHQLRSVLPAGAGPFIVNDSISLSDELEITGQAAQLEKVSKSPRSNEGGQRLDEIDAVLAIAACGMYLPKAKTRWAEDRRDELQNIVNNLRFEAAMLNFELSHFSASAKLVESVVQSEPFRESAWRLWMSVAAALGSFDLVLRIFANCTQAFAQIGAEPSRETKALFDRLRR